MICFLNCRQWKILQTFLSFNVLNSGSRLWLNENIFMTCLISIERINFLIALKYMSLGLFTMIILILFAWIHFIQFSLRGQFNKSIIIIKFGNRFIIFGKAFNNIIFSYKTYTEISWFYSFKLVLHISICRCEFL